MGERLLCKQEVDGSIPFASTARAADPGRLAMLMPSAGRPRMGSRIQSIRSTPAPFAAWTGRCSWTS